MDGKSSAGLRLPVQAAVNRTASYGALADGDGVDASFSFGDLFNTVSQVASSPVGQAILGGLTSIF
jgi:hypothetical protein